MVVLVEIDERAVSVRLIVGSFLLYAIINSLGRRYLFDARLSRRRLHILGQIISVIRIAVLLVLVASFQITRGRRNLLVLALAIAGSGPGPAALDLLGGRSRRRRALCCRRRRRRRRCLLGLLHDIGQSAPAPGWLLEPDTAVGLGRRLLRVHLVVLLIHPLVVEVRVQQPVSGHLPDVAAGVRAALVEAGRLVVHLHVVYPLVVGVGREEAVHEHRVLAAFPKRANPVVVGVCRVGGLLERGRVDHVVGVLDRAGYAALMLAHNFLETRVKCAELRSSEQVLAEVACRKEEAIVVDQTSLDLCAKLKDLILFAELIQIEFGYLLLVLVLEHHREEVAERAALLKVAQDLEGQSRH